MLIISRNIARTYLQIPTMYIYNDISHIRIQKKMDAKKPDPQDPSQRKSQ
jgi:hypothetical protein